MSLIASSDSIRIEGVMEVAEIVGENITKHSCENCGHSIQVSGGIVLNESLEFVDDQKSLACPRCRGVIRLHE
jgi:hypothetical protein